MDHLQSYYGVVHYVFGCLERRSKTILKTKPFALCILVVSQLASHQLCARDYGDPSPVLPIGADDLDDGTIYGPFYSVYDKKGKNYSGVVIGDSDFSITYPSDGGDAIMRSGSIISNLGH